MSLNLDAVVTVKPTKHQIDDIFEEIKKTLKNKEREIFEARLMTEDPPTLQEVGDRFNLSRERVRQIESKLKQRLREFIRERAADIDQAEQ